MSQWVALYIKQAAGTLTRTRITAGSGNTELHNVPTVANLEYLTDRGIVVGSYFNDQVRWDADGSVDPAMVGSYPQGSVSVETTNSTSNINTFIMESY